MKKLNLKSFIIATLRRSSYRWPPRNEAAKLARVERGLYKCASCANIVRNKEFAIDHIIPVVPLEGFTTWDDYINRMFCDVSGLQILCSPCHDLKTAQEKVVRKIKRTKKAKKKR